GSGDGDCGPGDRPGPGPEDRRGVARGGGGTSCGAGGLLGGGRGPGVPGGQRVDGRRPGGRRLDRCPGLRRPGVRCRSVVKGGGFMSAMPEAAAPSAPAPQGELLLEVERLQAEYRDVPVL